MSTEYEHKKAAYRTKLQTADTTAEDLLIGSWVTFYPFEKTCFEKQLDQLASYGINFNIFPRDFGGSAMYDSSYWDEIEAQYASRGMVYLMNGGPDASLIPVGVEYAAEKTHCIGYHVKDEPTGEDLPRVAKIIRAYREADSTRYPFTNLFPGYASEALLGGSYRAHVERFISLAGAKNVGYLSHDFYPFRANKNVMSIFTDMEILRSVAYANGKLKTHAFPQSCAWRGMRMPNIDEMRWHVYAYLAYGFKALSWFNLVCPGSSDTEGEGFYDALIYRDGTVRDPALLNAWSELNWEVRGLSHALMNLDTVHAYHTDNTIEGVEPLPKDFMIRPIENAPFVVSYMEAKDQSAPHIMLFNKSVTDSVEMDFFVDPSAKIASIEYLDPHTGEYVPVCIQNNILHDNFPAGQGKLYRIICAK